MGVDWTSILISRFAHCIGGKLADYLRRETGGQIKKRKDEPKLFSSSQKLGFRSFRRAPLSLYFLFILPPLENKSWLATYPILTLKSSVQRDFQWKISIPERVWILNLVGSQIQLFYRIRENLCATFYHVLWEHLDDCNVNLKRHTKVD